MASFPEFASSGWTSAPDDTLATIVPYRNPPALIAYYLGLFSLFPLLGAFLGIAALVLGILGLRRARANPQAKGKVHAWIGIICGGLFGTCWVVCDVGLLVGLLSGAFK